MKHPAGIIGAAPIEETGIAVGPHHCPVYCCGKNTCCIAACILMSLGWSSKSGRRMSGTSRFIPTLLLNCLRAWKSRKGGQEPYVPDVA